MLSTRQLAAALALFAALGILGIASFVESVEVTTCQMKTGQTRAVCAAQLKEHHSFTDHIKVIQW